MKELKNITEEEVKEICRLAGEPYLSFMAGKWEGSSTGLAVQIETTSTIHGSRHDSCIWIRKTGEIQLWRNTGEWNGHGYEDIPIVPIANFLRKRGYRFESDELLIETMGALSTATKIIEQLIGSKPVKNLDEHLAFFKSLTRHDHE